MRSPNPASVSRATASADGSRSRPSTRPAPASRSARLCPPSPTVQSTNSPPRAGSSSASTSGTMTGSCEAVMIRSELRQRLRVVVGIGVAEHLRDEPIVVPDVEVIDRAEHVDFSRHAGGSRGGAGGSPRAPARRLRRSGRNNSTRSRNRVRAGCVDGARDIRSSSASQTAMGYTRTDSSRQTRHEQLRSVRSFRPASGRRSGF